MKKILAVVLLLAPSVVLSRYVEDAGGDYEGAWLFAYAIIFFIAMKYIRTESKNGNGAKAVIIVSSLVAAAFVFPILNGIIILVAAVAFAYGMLTIGQK